MCKMKRITDASSRDGMRFSSQPFKGRILCCVSGCTSKACTEFTLRFHCFPRANEDFADVTKKFGCREGICGREVRKQLSTVSRLRTIRAHARYTSRKPITCSQDL